MGLKFFIANFTQAPIKNKDNPFKKKKKKEEEEDNKIKLALLLYQAKGDP